MGSHQAKETLSSSSSSSLDDNGHHHATTTTTTTNTTSNLPSTTNRSNLPPSPTDDDHDHDHEWRRYVESLHARINSLEAQNILVAAQMMDVLAHILCWCWTISAWLLYVVVVTQLWNHVPHHWVSFLGPSTTLPPVVVVVVVRLVLYLGLPLAHHRFTHGATHRLHYVFAVAAIIIVRLKLCQWREALFIKPHERNSIDNTYGDALTSEALWRAYYEINARFLYASARRLAGMWTKGAQYLACRHDVLPVPFCRELARLQDQAPATPWQEIQAQLPRRVRQALVDLEPTPVASASIGQVHRARLRATGEPVVVKIQHPGARRLIRNDLWAARIIFKVYCAVEPSWRAFEDVLEEWYRETPKELDFSIERTNLVDARASLTSLLPTPETVLYTAQGVPFVMEIPRPEVDLCTRDVLVMSFCEGVRVDQVHQLRDWRLDHHAVMDGISQTFAYMMYVGGIFNGDPHPGNLLIRPTQFQKCKQQPSGFTIAILDWGLAQRLPDNRRWALCQLVYAACTLDYGLLLDAYHHLDWGTDDVSSGMEHVRFFLRDMAPGEVSRQRVQARLQHSNDNDNQSSQKYPSEFFLFIRVADILQGLGSKFRIDLAYLDVLKPYVEGALRNSDWYRHATTNVCVPRPVPQDPSLQTKLEAVLDDLQRDGRVAGAQVCILNREGAPLVDHVLGHCGGLKDNLALERSTLILGFSCTKAVTATLAHLMVQEGYLTYDEPVCGDHIWPAFCPTAEPPTDLLSLLQKQSGLENIRQRWEWKRQITLRHILTHQAGMASALPAEGTLAKIASCETSVAAFEYNTDRPEATLLPTSAPETSVTYHYYSFGWLVAGTLCGAYAQRHGKGKERVTFEEVYKALLLPRLSQATLRNGFRPCGGTGDFHWALTVAEANASQILQVRKESHAMGEGTDDDENTDSLHHKLRDFRGKEFLLDPRIWNSHDGLNATVPAATGRFSAVGLAHFYHDLGSGKILNPETLHNATVVGLPETGKSFLQGVTSSFQAIGTETSDTAPEDTNATTTTTEASGPPTIYAMGYQFIRFQGDGPTDLPVAFGHGGVGGSMGLYHPKAGLSVGVMVNKADAGKDVTLRILQTLSEHFTI